MFVDTSIWYSAADVRDSQTEIAQSLLIGKAGALVTSDLVLAELWNLVNARADHYIANRVTTAISGGVARVECAIETDLEVAAAILEAFRDQAFSLTDRTSWAIMERLGITDALALDADFRIYRYGPQKRRAFAVLP